MNLDKLIAGLQALAGAIPDCGAITIYRSLVRFDTDNDAVVQQMAAAIGASIETVRLEKSSKDGRAVWWLCARAKINDHYVEITGKHHHEDSINTGVAKQSLNDAGTLIAEAVNPPAAECKHRNREKGDEFNPDRCRDCFVPLWEPIRPVPPSDDRPPV